MNTELINTKQTEWQTRYWLTNITRGEIIAEIETTIDLDPNILGEHNGLGSYCAELFNVSTKQISDELKAYNTLGQLLTIVTTQEEQHKLRTVSPSFLALLPKQLSDTDKLFIITNANTQKEVKQLVKERQHKEDNKAQQLADEENIKLTAQRDSMIERAKAKMKAKDLAIEKAETERLELYNKVQEAEDIQPKLVTEEDMKSKVKSDFKHSYFKYVGIDYKGDINQQARAEALYKTIQDEMIILTSKIAEIRAIDESLSLFSIFENGIAIENS